MIRKTLPLMVLVLSLSACGGGDDAAPGPTAAPAGDTAAAPAATPEPTAPADSAGEAISLVIWHAYRGNEKAAFEKVIGLFNDANAGQVSVRPLAVPYDAYADKITAAIPRGKGPDVFIFAQDRLGGWVEAGKTVESIDFYLDDETVDQMLPNMMSAMTYRDTVYGLPLNYKMVTLIYNKALVDAPPTSSGQLIEMAKGMTERASGTFGLAYTYSDYYYHSALMNAFGGRVFEEGAAPVIDNPQNVAAIEEMMRWYKDEGVLPDDPSTALITRLFNDGKAAMVISGPWFLGEVNEDVDVGLAPLPTVDAAGGEPMRPWLTIEGVYISPGSANKEAAYELSKFLVSAEAAKIFATEGGQLPTNAGVYDDPAVAADPVLSGFRQQLATSIPMPNYAEMTLMWSPVTTAMNKIVKGSASPQQALSEAQETIVKDIEVLRQGR